MRKCSLCKTEKPLSDFYMQRKRNRPASVCKPCGVIKAREYRHTNPDFEKRRYQRDKDGVRNRHLIRKYGISSEQYKQMLLAQGGKCAICKGVAVEQRNKTLHVDHCHATGAIRGLLCWGCNHILGVVKDDPKILLAAASYLSPQAAAEFIRASGLVAVASVR